MASEVELQRMMVRLMGDGSSYSQMMQTAAAETQKTQGIIAAAGAKIEGVVNRLESAGQAIKGFGTTWSLAITTPLVAAGYKMVMMASDAAETASKFETVFSGVSDKAHAAADELTNFYGMSSTGAKKALGDTADLLTGFGFTQQQALELSQEAQKLAVDLASFTNVAGGAERASDALTRGLLGERESMKALGIAIVETSPEWKAMLANVKATTGLTGTQAKAYTTLKLAQQQSKNAIGDYARTQGGFANSVRHTGAMMQDLSEKVGNLLMPLFQRWNQLTQQAISYIMDLDPWIIEMAVKIGLVAAAIGPLLVALGGLMTAAPFALIAAKAMLFASALGAIAAGIAALIGKDNIMSWLSKAKGFIMNFQENMIILYEWLKGYWVKLYNNAIEFFNQFRGLWQTISDAGADTFTMVIGYFSDFFGKALGFFMNFRENVANIWKWLGENWWNILKDMFQAWVLIHMNMFHNLGVVLNMGFSLFNAFFGWLVGLFERFWTEDFVNSIVDGLKAAWDMWVGWCTKAWEYLKNLFKGDEKSITIDNLLKRVEKDMVQGAENLNFIETATDIIKRDSANLKSPLEGFVSNLTDLPELNLSVNGVELPKFVFEKGELAGEELEQGVVKGVEEAVKAVNHALGQVFKNDAVRSDSDELFELLGRRAKAVVDIANGGNDPQPGGINDPANRPGLLARRGMNHIQNAMAEIEAGNQHIANAVAAGPADIGGVETRTLAGSDGNNKDVVEKLQELIEVVQNKQEFKLETADGSLQ